jgi:hypothetical protein
MCWRLSTSTHATVAGGPGCLAPDRIDAPLDAAGRYGRMFDLPPLTADETLLRAIGASGGLCDAGDGGDEATIEAGWPLFGQYVAHDLTADRSPLSKHAELESLGNMRSSRANLEPLYGAGPAGSPYLYQRLDSAKLLESHGDLPRNQEGTALIGDPRNDSHIFMSQLQLAFIRAHNRLVDRLRADGVDEPRLFDEARRGLTWHYQWVIVNEFLPVVAGSSLVNRILTEGPRFYRPRGDTYIPVEFADAAYRYGHSQIREFYVLRPDGPVVKFFPDLMGFGPIGDRSVDWSLLFDVPGHQSAQRAKPIDGRLVQSLISLPQAISGAVTDPSYASLAARDLQRGRGLNLPSGESVARLMDAVVLDEDEVGLSAHGWTVETPLWLYIQREAAVRHAGDKLGEVGGTITAEVLIGVIGRDPESYLTLAPDWQPNLPAREGGFKLRDLLIAAA